MLEPILWTFPLSSSCLWKCCNVISILFLFLFTARFCYIIINWHFLTLDYYCPLEEILLFYYLWFLFLNLIFCHLCNRQYISISYPAVSTVIYFSLTAGYNRFFSSSYPAVSTVIYFSLTAGSLRMLFLLFTISRSSKDIFCTNGGWL